MYTHHLILIYLYLYKILLLTIVRSLALVQLTTSYLVTHCSFLLVKKFKPKKKQHFHTVWFDNVAIL